VVDITCQAARKRKDHFGDIDFFYEGFIVDDRHRGNEHGLLDHKPGCQPGKKKDDIIFDLKLDNL